MNIIHRPSSKFTVKSGGSLLNPRKMVNCQQSPYVVFPWATQITLPLYTISRKTSSQQVRLPLLCSLMKKLIWKTQTNTLGAVPNVYFHNIYIQHYLIFVNTLSAKPAYRWHLTKWYSVTRNIRKNFLCSVNVHINITVHTQLHKVLHIFRVFDGVIFFSGNSFIENYNFDSHWVIILETSFSNNRTELNFLS